MVRTSSQGSSASEVAKSSPLVALWRKSPDQLREKLLQQVVAFAGQGRLKDGSDASTDLRSFLAEVPSPMLIGYARQCLTASFEDKGYALQDIVNEMGHRLGFEVVPGRYRGVPREIGFDGLWKAPDGYALVVEVKTTDRYRILLDTLAGYRRRLIDEQRIESDQSSMLVVVGHEDTGDLEAQIRGGVDLRVDALSRKHTFRAAA